MALSSDEIRGQLRDEGILLRRTWLLFRKDAAPLIVGMLLIILVLIPTSWVCGLLSTGVFLSGHMALGLAFMVAVMILPTLFVMPLAGGLIGIVIRRVRQHRRGAAREVFAGYDQFPDLLLASIAVLACLAPIMLAGLLLPASLRQLASLVGFPLVVLPIVYLFPTIVDRRLSFASALRRSVRLVRGNNLWRTLVAVLAYGLATALFNYLTMIPQSLPSGPLTTLLQVVLVVAQALLVLPLSIVYLTCMYFCSLGEEHLLDTAIATADTPLEAKLLESPEQSA